MIGCTRPSQSARTYYEIINMHWNVCKLPLTCTRVILTLRSLNICPSSASKVTANMMLSSLTKYWNNPVISFLISTAFVCNNKEKLNQVCWIDPSLNNLNSTYVDFSFTDCFLKPGFHTCVSRTHHSARCLKMYGHQWSQAITAFATKACELATKSHTLNFCEDLCCDMLWLWSIETNNVRKKDFLSPRKKEQSQKLRQRSESRYTDKMQEAKKNFCPPKKKQSQKQKNSDDFQKVVIYNKMHKIKIIFCFPEKKQSQKQKK